MWETCQGYETMGACREEPPPHALLVQLQCQTGQSIITKTSAYFPIQAMIKCQEARRKSPSWKMVCIWIHLSLTNQEVRWDCEWAGCPIWTCSEMSSLLPQDVLEQRQQSKKGLQPSAWFSTWCKPCIRTISLFSYIKDPQSWGFMEDGEALT